MSDRKTLLCFGYGYSASTLAEHLAVTEPGCWRCLGTRTNPPATRDGATTLLTYSGGQPTTDLRNAIASATHILVSIPPDLEGDPVVRDFADAIATAPALEWIGYYSTIGVYGDVGGAWIDETAPLRPSSERSLRRVRAESDWQKLAANSGARLNILRLPGIYGPGRSVIEALRTGTARRIVKPEQVFNRIHVLDIARATAAAMNTRSTSTILNVTDDEPSPPQDVVAYAADLLGLPPPPEVPFDAAAMTPMARSFYAENKRVSNARMKSELSFALAFPTYREGLLDILRAT
ncbi:MAG TPA: SDR family oxidoreductase [Hyphomicrobiaceae bacterium]|nr:SDR family oxidoreductase [Hyphomicrobiaceae bacterium]